MPSMVINRNDAQYGTETMVFIATHGVYNVMPSMNRFRTMNVADARRRTNLLLNLEILKKKRFNLEYSISLLQIYKYFAITDLKICT